MAEKRKAIDFFLEPVENLCEAEESNLIEKLEEAHLKKSSPLSTDHIDIKRNEDWGILSNQVVGSENK